MSIDGKLAYLKLEYENIHSKTIIIDFYDNYPWNFNDPIYLKLLQIWVNAIYIWVMKYIIVPYSLQHYVFLDYSEFYKQFENLHHSDKWFNLSSFTPNFSKTGFQMDTTRGTSLYLPRMDFVSPSNNLQYQRIAFIPNPVWFFLSWITPI